jgi:hypothetical protein
MKRGERLGRVGWWLLLAGPWVAVLVLFWREQTLENQLADFVAKVNLAQQKALDELIGSTQRAMDEAFERAD